MPRKHPPRDAAARIEARAADGFSIIGIAKSMGTTREVLTRWMEEQPALREAFEHGREHERYALHNKLFEAAMNGNVISAMFLLKARHGYREGADVEHVTNVRLSFTLPAPMEVEEYRRLVDVAGVAAKRLAAPLAGRS
jgi:hypothetical protein